MHQESYSCLLQSTIVCLPLGRWDSAELAVVLAAAVGRWFGGAGVKGGGRLTITVHTTARARREVMACNAHFACRNSPSQDANWWECMMYARVLVTSRST